MTETAEIIFQMMKDAGVPLTENMATQFDCYRALLLEKNEVMNLTAITDFEGIVYKHFVDSCAALPILRQEEAKRQQIRMIDIGTGAGFPGIPLKIVMPSVRLTLLDSLNKRVKFLEEAGDKLSLENVQYIHARAEDGIRLAETTDGKILTGLRESFDLTVSRAVSALPVLLEYCLPYVKVGGVFIAYKSESTDEEVRGAAYALKVLGGTVENIERFKLPGTGDSRSLIMIRKTEPTPKRFPRKAGTPVKKPLI